MSALPETMRGAVLTGHGGPERLTFRNDLAVPSPGPEDVLIRVRASSVNNTDINTRTGWYSKSVASATAVGAGTGHGRSVEADGSWSGVPVRFPRIQGADCCGDIVAVGSDVSKGRLGERVLVRTMLRAPVAFRPFECWTFGSECDGGFAEFAVAPSIDVFAVDSPLDPTELGVIPCAFGTAEGMLQRAAVRAGDHVLVTGASGGVGSALVQLTKLRGARVTAVASRSKHDGVRSLGADHVIARDADLLAEMGRGSVSVVADLVAGPTFRTLPELLRRGGRYVTAGAIAGPDVAFDLRTLYLNDLSFFGCAAQDDRVFEALVAYLESGALRPKIARTYPLEQIHAAQAAFLDKQFTGKIAIVP